MSNDTEAVIAAGHAKEITDADIHRIALYFIGSHLANYAESVLNHRVSSPAGMARIPNSYSDADTRRIWEEVRHIGLAMWQSNDELSPKGATHAEPGATPQEAQ